MKNIKINFIALPLLLLSVFTTCYTFGQRIPKKYQKQIEQAYAGSKSISPQIEKLKNNYLVYEVNNNNFQASFYNNSFELINEITQKLKTNETFTCNLTLLDTILLFNISSFPEENYSQILLSNKGELLKYNTFTAAEGKKDLIPSDINEKENYRPSNTDIAVAPSSKGITINNNYIELLYNLKGNKLVKTDPKFKYNGEPVIRGFTINEASSSLSFKRSWEIELNHEKINDYQWHKFDEQFVYLLIGEKKKKNYQSYLYKIDIKKGVILYKNEISIGAEYFSTFSTLAGNNDGNIVIIGNYGDVKGYKQYKFSTFEGWFSIKLDKKGNVITSKHYPFTIDSPNLFKNKTFTNAQMQYLCINFAGVNVDTLGNIQLIGNNIRIFENTKSTNQPNYTHSFKEWQVIGYSYFLLDSELEIVNKISDSKLYFDADNKGGHSMPFQPIGGLLDEFTLISKGYLNIFNQNFLPYGIQSYAFDENGVSIISCQNESFTEGGIPTDDKLYFQNFNNKGETGKELLGPGPYSTFTSDFFCISSKECLYFSVKEKDNKFEIITLK